MVKVIAICSQKGGVGKTTTVINLAGFLSLSGQRTLVIDLDPQANCTSGLSGKEMNEHPIKKLSDIRGEWPQLVQETKWKSLFLIASSTQHYPSPDEESLQNLLVNPFRTHLFRKDFEFDYILIDAPPTAGPILQLAMKLADEVLIPVQCEYFALEGLSKILPMLEQIGKSRAQPLKIAGLLLTMFDEETELSFEVQKELESHFPDSALKTIIPRDVKLAEAASHGIPIFEYDIRSRGAFAYFNLAKEIMSHDK